MSVAADHAEIVREVCQYVIDFVEQPQAETGEPAGLSIRPEGSAGKPDPV